MIPEDFTIDAASWSNDDDRAACMRVRENVFQLEQKVPREDEIDDIDPTARHLVARDLQGNPIGTGRLTTQHVIGRSAVEPAWRSRGVGAAMLQRLIDLARALNFPCVVLHAQSQALQF